MKQKEELKLASLENIRCPQCNGLINRVWFHTYDALSSDAIFIAECWSGGEELGKSQYHLFKIRVPINAEVDLTEVEAKQ